MKPERLGRKVIHKSPWLNLYLDTVKFPGGKLVDDYHLVDFENESVAVVVENDKNEILMIQSYRYVTDYLDWEIPAGRIEKGDSMIEAAKRETLEETGYDIENLKHIYTYNPSNGNSNQVFHILKGKVVNRVSEEFDKNEVKDCRWVSLDKIKDMIAKNEIRDGYTLTAILLYFLGY